MGHMDFVSDRGSMGRAQRSSVVTITFPSRRPKRLANSLRQNNCLARERDWAEDFMQRDGHVFAIRAVKRGVEVDVWLGAPRPAPPRPPVPLPPTYERRGL